MKYDLTRWEPHGYSCPVEAAVDVVGGKWKSVILYQLSKERRCFNELRRLIPGVTQRMLTLQLRELERDGIIHREVYKQVPPKVEYYLTPFGETLIPIIELMFKWGYDHTDKIAEARIQAEKE
ncbi:winged helix-turn-helix transcriptional regulator [Priestia megaterium]|uniref:winged helix-turn-helix transcriptional regulator n=1 Tax=Priestia megaterium TaxID=1404 RepID=UPI0036DB9C35